MQLLEQHKEEIARICKNHYVEKLYVFGSILNDSFNAESDIDLVVNFANVPLLEYFNNFMGFKEELESLLGRKVDLIENKAVKNPVFRRILDREMQHIYERTAA